MREAWVTPDTEATDLFDEIRQPRWVEREPFMRREQQIEFVPIDVFENGLDAQHGRLEGRVRINCGRTDSDRRTTKPIRCERQTGKAIARLREERTTIGEVDRRFFRQQQHRAMCPICLITESIDLRDAKPRKHRCRKIQPAKLEVGGHKLRHGENRWAARILLSDEWSDRPGGQSEQDLRLHDEMTSKTERLRCTFDHENRDLSNHNAHDPNEANPPRKNSL